MKTTLLVAAIAAGITLAASAEAREGHGDRGERGGARIEMPTFEELDANGDGAVTTDEINAAMQARADARFAEMDTDGDGALSAEELVAQADADRAARMAERIAGHIEKADTNGDGLLQPDEVGARSEDRSGPGAERMFERFDADDNGSLSAEEFAQALERMAERGDRGDRDRRDN